MPAMDNQVPEAFKLACNAVCSCVANLAELRIAWQFYRQDGYGELHCSSIAGTLLRLTYHLKRAKGLFPAVEWPIRTLYNEPPEPVGNISKSCYHEIGISLAETAVWQIAPAAQLGNELLDPLAGLDLSEADLWKLLNSQRAQIEVKVCIDRNEKQDAWGQLSSALDSLPDFNAGELIARVRIEAAHAAKKVDPQVEVKRNKRVEWKVAQSLMLTRLQNKTLPESIRDAAKLIDHTFSTTRDAVYKSDSLKTHFRLSKENPKTSGDKLLEELTSQADARTKRYLKNLPPDKREEVEAQLHTMPANNRLELLRTLATSPDGGSCGDVPLYADEGATDNEEYDNDD